MKKPITHRRDERRAVSMTDKQQRFPIARVKDHEERLNRLEAVLRTSAMALGQMADDSAKAVACGEDAISPIAEHNH